MGHALAIAGIPREEQRRLILQMLEKPPTGFIQLLPQEENACYGEEVCWGNIHKKYNQTGNPQESHSQEKSICSSFSFAVSIKCPYQVIQLEKQNAIFRVLVPGS